MLICRLVRPLHVRLPVVAFGLMLCLLLCILGSSSELCCKRLVLTFRDAWTLNLYTQVPACVQRR